MKALPRVLVFALAVSLALAGCLVGERGPENDSDGDYLEDVVETEGWNITIRTRVPQCFTFNTPDPGTTLHVDSNPADGDSDVDGLTDAQENQWGSHPRERDTDGDGLDDKREYDLNQARTFQIPTGLHLYEADSDEDCLSDREEIDGFELPNLGHRTTDPTEADTDRDGFSDPNEIRRVGTDPTNPDTDGDGAGERIDIDPLHDVAIDLVFVSLELKPHVASGEVAVRLPVQFSAQGGPRTQLGDAFNARPGQSTPVPPASLPGTLDVNDGTGVGYVLVDFWAERVEGGPLDAVPGATEGVARMQLWPQNGTWAIGELRGQAGEAHYAIEGDDARLEFRVAVRFL